jgi:hypothetical protein
MPQATIPLIPSPTERSIQPSAPTLPLPVPPPAPARTSAQRFAANRAQCLAIPIAYKRLEPGIPFSVVNDDPVFDVHSAAGIVGLSADSLDKRRQRGQPPDYIQYDSQFDGPGPVPYALSALMKFRETHTFYPSRKKQ